MGANASKLPAPATTVEALDEKHSVRAVSPEPVLAQGAALSLDGSLTLSNIASWESSIATTPKLALARTILQHSDIRAALQSRNAHIANTHVFNTEVSLKTGSITNQKSSGRCWLFATTNVLRYEVMRKLGLKEFELSQSYLYFYDKLNKSNYYLELMIEHADLPVDDRLINHLSGDLISDGGQWDMAVNLLETYGVLPQAVFPESTHSSLSGPLNTLLKTKLREHALTLRALASSPALASLSAEARLASLRAKKEALVKEVYTIMSATLGTPPAPDAAFTWDYYDKDGKAGTWTGTPREFYDKVAKGKYEARDSFSLINDPRNEYGKLYTVDKLGNLWGGRPVLYVNTDVQTLKSTALACLRAGTPVFFGCDVGKYSDSTRGIMDTGLYAGAHALAFDVELALTKRQRLEMGESAMTHAMVLAGAHVVKGADGREETVRWKVENSWGEASGEKGWFVMSDAWFDEFVYQVVVPKALAPKELVKVFEGEERKVLAPWDPMGSLA